MANEESMPRVTIREGKLYVGQTVNMVIEGIEKQTVKQVMLEGESLLEVSHFRWMQKQLVASHDLREAPPGLYQLVIHTDTDVIRIPEQLEILEETLAAVEELQQNALESQTELAGEAQFLAHEALELASEERTEAGHLAVAALRKQEEAEQAGEFAAAAEALGEQIRQDLENSAPRDKDCDDGDTGSESGRRRREQVDPCKQGKTAKSTSPCKEDVAITKLKNGSKVLFPTWKVPR